MTDRIQRGGLQIAPVLCELLENDIAPGTGIAPEQFWQGLAAIVTELAPINRALLATREEMQAEIDAWHQANPGAGYDRAAYKSFLGEIGYLLPGVTTSPLPPKMLTRRSPPSPAPAGRAGNERPLRTECRQCPLGQPLRRPLRHRCHP